MIIYTHLCVYIYIYISSSYRVMCQSIGNIMGSERVNLPPGFVFSPTDEELVLHFLHPKAFLLPCHPNIIPDLDHTQIHPFQLNGKALSSENQFYFFTRYEKKRVTESGHWKEIGVTESIVSSAAGKKIGMKKYLEFNNGEAPHGTETSWLMQEYHLCPSGFNTRPTSKPDKNKWVLCRVYEKQKDSEDDENDVGGSTELSWMDQVFMSTLDDEGEEEISFP